MGRKSDADKRILVVNAGAGGGMEAPCGAQKERKRERGLPPLEDLRGVRRRRNRQSHDTAGQQLHSSLVVKLQRRRAQESHVAHPTFWLHALAAGPGDHALAV